MSGLKETACNFHEKYFYEGRKISEYQKLYHINHLALLPEDCANICHKEKACRAAQFTPKYWSALSTIPIRVDVALGKFASDASSQVIGREVHLTIARFFGSRACRGESCIIIRDVGKMGNIEMWIRAPLAHAKELSKLLVQHVTDHNSKLRKALPPLTGHIEVLSRSKFQATASAAKCANTVAATCWGATLHNAVDDPYECEGLECEQRECCVEGVGECLMGTSKPVNASSNPAFSCFLKE